MGPLCVPRFIPTALATTSVESKPHPAGEIHLICEACKRQIGLRAAWHAHSRLSPPGAPGTSGYRAKAFQKLYLCFDCGTVLTKGPNTGWLQAVQAVH